MQISKSDYMMFLKQPAWLWLKKHDKTKLPPIDDNTQAIFDAGNLFESYAEKLFPSGLRLGFIDYAGYLALADKTREAIVGDAKTLFQAKFQTDQLAFICDVVEILDDQTINLYEIKSSTSAKPEHILDLAFQVVVLQENGFEVRNISVIHVNNNYVRRGEVDTRELSASTDVTATVKAKLEYTRQQIAAALKIIQLPKAPDISPTHAKLGAFGEWLGIYRSLSNLPLGSIYDLCSLNADKVRRLEALGVTRLVDIPADFALSPKQTLQVRAAKLNQQLIEPGPIRQFIQELRYPLYFLDYETLGGVVPAFDGMRPYQQLPFQYSLHVIDSPGAKLRHVEYLHRENSNPALNLSKTLQTQIGTTGSIITWNMGFEKSCNLLLGSLLPDYQKFYASLNARIVDLMLPFSNGWFVDQNFYGSASIKKVLPVVVPELSYKMLNVQEGASAQRLWMQAVIDGKDSIDKEVLFADLTEYCKLDTLAMVEIFNVLRKL